MGVARPPTQLDHLCNQAQSDAIRRQSLWASRGRPRSWITCAIRRNQTQSGGNRYGRRAAAHAAGWPVQSGAIRRNQEAIIMGVAWPPTQLDGLCNQMQSDAINRQSGGHQRGHQRPSETIRGAIRGASEAHQRRIRGDHLRALEIAFSLESVDQTCGGRRRGERLHAEAQSRLPSRSRA